MELFSPFRESPNHFTNSCEGGAGNSSAFDDVTFAGMAGRGGAAGVTRIATAGVVSVEDDALVTTFAAELDVAIAGRVAATAAPGTLPPVPTVVHAPPDDTAGGAGL